MSRIGLVSLGCAKNQVNSEQMLFLLNQAGYEIAAGVENTDVVIVNTCGFIDSAKSEAIDNILALAELKARGGVGKILVAGCLAQRYQKELLDELPEVDGIIGCGSYADVVSAVTQAINGIKPVYLGDIDHTDEEIGRVITTPEHYAYLKIAEGCDNRCSYCVIPSLRGKFRSRELDALVSEAEQLAAENVKELIIVAQDISRYGLDLYGKRSLAELLRRLCGIEGVEWIRLHYLYPDEIDDELIDVIAGQEKILKYLDIPIQHCNDEILKAMNRRGTKAELISLFTEMRRRIPGLVLRTSIICGLPGETEERFDELCGFLRLVKIERAGVFPYSPEEGTKASEMPGRPDEDTVAKRVELLLDIQSRIMDDFNRAQKGKTLRVVCEGFEDDLYFGRSYADSPDIDARILFQGPDQLKQGDFVDVLIQDALDGDLVGRAV